MKKVISIFILSILIFGCSKDPKSILISKAEEELKISMHDPSSYEFVSFEEDFQKKADEQIENKKLNFEPEYQSDSKYYRLTYRGKNKLGALILNEIYVIASNDENLSFYRLED